MIFDFKHIRTNVSEMRSTLVGTVLLVLGIVIAATPFVLVAKDLALDPSTFSVLQEYAKWVAGGFILLGLILIGLIQFERNEGRNSNGH